MTSRFAYKGSTSCLMAILQAPVAILLISNISNIYQIYHFDIKYISNIQRPLMLQFLSINPSRQVYRVERHIVMVLMISILVAMFVGLQSP